MVFRPVFVDEKRRRREHHVEHSGGGEHHHVDFGAEHEHGDHVEHPVVGRFGVELFRVGFFGVELDVRPLFVAGLGCAVVASACATAQVALPPEEASRVERQLTGETRYLRVSLYDTPFFGDSTKRLVTAVPPALVRLLNNPDGTPVNPGKAEGIFVTGTPVRIEKIEFPTNTTMAERVLFTPRTLAWVYLDIAGTAKKSAPRVLVLRPGLRTENEFLSELERYVTHDDPSKRLEAFTDLTRDAVKAKNAVIDMPSEALEMAWGPPERKVLTFDGDKKRETWAWADGERTAVLVDGRLVSFKDRN